MRSLLLSIPQNCFSLHRNLLFSAVGLLLFNHPGWAAAPGCIGFAAIDGDNSIGMSIAGGTTGGNGGTTVTVSTQSALETALGNTGPQVIQISGPITITPF